MASSSTITARADTPLLGRHSLHSQAYFSLLSVFVICNLFLYIIHQTIDGPTGLIDFFPISLVLLLIFIFAHLILQFLSDPAVTKRFLFVQFLLSVFPLYHLAGAITESLHPILERTFSLLDKFFSEESRLSKTLSPIYTQLKFTGLSGVLTGTLLGFFILLEVSMLLVTRRYRTIEREAITSGTQGISARGNLAAAYMTGLGFGFVTLGNIGQAMQGWMMGTGLVLVVLSKVWMTVFSIGMHFCVGLTLAQIHLFDVHRRMLKTGLLMALWMGIPRALITCQVTFKMHNGLITALSQVLSGGLVVFAGVHMRRRYRLLLKRESAV